MSCSSVSQDMLNPNTVVANVCFSVLKLHSELWIHWKFIFKRRPIS